MNSQERGEKQKTHSETDHPAPASWIGASAIPQEVNCKLPPPQKQTNVINSLRNSINPKNPNNPTKQRSLSYVV